LRELALPFDTTRWSVVLAASADDPDTAREALATLCATYWFPLYAYVRRRGRTPDEARDLTQAFLASLLERQSLRTVRRARGRFRTFLLSSLAHFLANEAARRRARKRGGGLPPLPLDLRIDGAEAQYTHEPADAATPESLFDRRWALAVIDRVLAGVRADWTAAGRETEFDRLKPFLLGDAARGAYEAIARDLAMTEGAARVTVHRLRRTVRDRLRQHIAETVSDPSEVDDEIRYLIRTLSR
jgi:DNA-directed RNA polymerase specialized sigma24 family protein